MLATHTLYAQFRMHRLYCTNNICKCLVCRGSIVLQFSSSRVNYLVHR